MRKEKRLKHFIKKIKINSRIKYCGLNIGRGSLINHRFVWLLWQIDFGILFLNSLIFRLKLLKEVWGQMIFLKNGNGSTQPFHKLRVRAQIVLNKHFFKFFTIPILRASFSCPRSFPAPTARPVCLLHR